MIVKKTVVLVLLMFLFVWTGVASANYSLEVNNLPSTALSPGGGWFTFDVWLSQASLSDVDGWQFQIDILGRSGQDDISIDFTTTKNIKNDSNYLFFGDSDQYDASMFGGDNNKILANDFTQSNSGHSAPGLLATVKVDYGASAFGTYDILMGLGSQVLFDTSFNSDTGVNFSQGEIMGTFAVAPEPISSTLFIVGGATLGFRRFRMKRRNA